MERVLLLGYGSLAFKAAQLIKELKPEADLLWIAEYSEEKYPLEVVELLLGLGDIPAGWPRTRAKIKTDFEKRTRLPHIQPKLVKKVRFDKKSSEVSFLSNSGNMNFYYDQAFVFPGPAFKAPERAPEDGLLWPQSSCVEHLVSNWNQVDVVQVVGDDLSAVQAMASGNKPVEWLRSGNFFSRQIQFFLDEYLISRGAIVCMDSDPGHNIQGGAGDGPRKAAVYCSTPVLDLERLALMGIDAPEQDSRNQAVFIQDNVCLIAPYAAQNYYPGATPLDNGVETASQAVKSLLGKHALIFPEHGSRVWNLGGLYAGITGMSVQQALDRGYKPEWGIVSGPERPLSNQRHAAHLIVDTESRCILGMEGAGNNVPAWVEMISLLISRQGSLDDLLNQELFSCEFGLHPLKRCARIVKNKLESNVLGINPDELEQSYAQGAEFFVLDVRSPEEFKDSRIAGAENIPLPELKKKVFQIPRFVPLVLYSGCSGRAYQGARLLRSMGARQLYVLDGGMQLWPLAKESEQAPGPIMIQSGCSTC
ncbi:rhodanese-like domain-containing protein [Desulfonatronospira sp.]|uniref:rhodanese-like domain-containing protein n=1 Tax=Desulfonatronospira sp. TaxID=1962951 RepID=UPI0025BF9B8D|nr:rhodanese-like domain-containing protein [Desulfonatronospira sp.]